MKRSKVLCVAFAAMLAAALVPTVGFANGTGTDSLQLGGAQLQPNQALSPADDAHEHDGIAFLAWTDDTALPLIPGNYYLATNVQLASAWIPTANSTTRLCLNGHTVNSSTATAINMSQASSNVEIYDVEGENGGLVNGAVVVDASSARLTLNGGTVREVQVKSGELVLDGGIVDTTGWTGVSVLGGSFLMASGAVNNGNVGVEVKGTGQFTMVGGSMSGHSEAGVKLTSGYFTMKSGDIESNQGTGVVMDNGTFVMEGGRITSNAAGVVSNAGAVTLSGDASVSQNQRIGVYANGCAFAMSGGTVTANGAEGLYLSSNSEAMSLSDGTVSANGGAGVRVQQGTFALSGGSVVNNKGGGVYVSGSATFNLQGGPAISGNKSGTAACNICLDDGAKVTAAGPLTGAWGITSLKAPQVGLPVTVTSGLSANGAYTNFSSDNSAYVVGETTAGGEANLQVHVHKWSVVGSGDTVTLKCTADYCPFETGKEYTLKLSAEGWTYGETAKPASYETSEGFPADAESDKVAIGDISYYDSEGALLSGVPTNAGTYTAKVGVSGGTAENTAFAEAEFTVGQKQAELSWSNTALTYNKAAQKPTAEVSNLESGDTCAVTVGGEQTAANAEGEPYTATATGLSNANYKLPDDPTTAFTIARKTVRVSGITATSRDYDGTTDVTLDCSAAEFAGLLTGDALSVSATGAFADKNAGAGKTVNITGLTLGGASVANYALDSSGQQATAQAAIWQREVGLDWGGSDNYNFTYDAQPHVPAATATQVVEGDECIVVVDGEQTVAGTHDARAVRLAGASAANYKLPTAESALTRRFYIAKREVVVSSITAKDKPYDGTTAAELDCSSALFENIAGDDELEVTATGAFVDEQAGAGKRVNISNLVLGGQGADNYLLPAGKQQTHTAATIFPRTVGLEWSADGFVYDGTEKTPTATVAAGDLIGADECEVQVTGGQVNAGEGYVATASGLTNANYALPDDATTTFDIAPRPVVISGVKALDKTYDGMTAADLDCSGAIFTGLVGYDKLSVSAAGTFEDANVGSNKTVALRMLGLSGASAANYTLADSGHQATTTASISRRIAVVTARDQVVKLNGSIDSNATEAVLEDAAVGHALASVRLESTSTEHVTDSGTITPSAARIVDAQGSNVTSNYALSYSSGVLTVEPVQAVITEYPAPLSLTYNGRAQALCTAGRVEGGTLMFSYTRDGSYSPSVPTGAEAGRYTVWYRVDADSDHIGVPAATFATNIVKAVPNLGKVTADTVTDDLDASNVVLHRSDNTVEGDLQLVESELVYGTVTYHWVFEPLDDVDYESTEGTVSVTVTGHEWGEPTYRWSSDKATVTATRVCENNPAHIETETVSTTSAVTVEPTTTDEGVRTYTSGTFANEAFSVQTATEAIPVIDEPASPAEPVDPVEPAVELQAMHRLYNPYSGEHFYTADDGERDNLVTEGWVYEGVGWTAPVTSDSPVFRLYNSYAGEHHYTLSADERDDLVEVGWTDEGVGWYSDAAATVPLYRQYNPYEFACNHNYTTSEEERDWLVGLGWLDEGIAWYGAE